MCVVGHSYGGVGGGRDGGVGGLTCGIKPMGWSHAGRCRSTYRVRADIVMTPDHNNELQ